MAVPTFGIVFSVFVKIFVFSFFMSNNKMIRSECFGSSETFLFNSSYNIGYNAFKNMRFSC